MHWKRGRNILQELKRVGLFWFYFLRATCVFVFIYIYNILLKINSKIHLLRIATSLCKIVQIYRFSQYVYKASLLLHFWLWCVH